jgi:hypothetical protein
MFASLARASIEEDPGLEPQYFGGCVTATTKGRLLVLGRPDYRAVDEPLNRGAVVGEDRATR